MAERRRARVHAEAPGPVEAILASVLVALLGLPLLAAALGVACLRPARRERARTDVAVIRQAIEIYRATHGDECPASVGELVDEGVLSRAVTIEDPWGGEFWILCQAEPAIVVGTSGPDGRPFTADDVRSDVPYGPGPSGDGSFGRQTLLALGGLLAAFAAFGASRHLARRRLVRAIVDALTALDLAVERPQPAAPRRIWLAVPSAGLHVEAVTTALGTTRLHARRLDLASTLPQTTARPTEELVAALEDAGPSWSFGLSHPFVTASRWGAEREPARLAAALRVLAALSGAPIEAPPAAPYR